MAAGVFELKLFGDKQLTKQLSRLPFALQQKVLRKAFRGALKRVKNEILINLSGRVVQEQTGRYVNAMERQNPRISFTKDGAVLAGTVMPTRASLGISDKGGYYPAVLEYGVKKGPRQFDAFAPIRKAVNARQDAELRQIGDEIGAGIVREAAKK